MIVASHVFLSSQELTRQAFCAVCKWELHPPNAYINNINFRLVSGFQAPYFL